MTPMRGMKTCLVATRPDSIDRENEVDLEVKVFGLFLPTYWQFVDDLERHSGVGQASPLKPGRKAKISNVPMIFHNFSTGADGGCCGGRAQLSELGLRALFVRPARFISLFPFEVFKLI